MSTLPSIMENRELELANEVDKLFDEHWNSDSKQPLKEAVKGLVMKVYVQGLEDSVEAIEEAAYKSMKNFGW